MDEEIRFPQRHGNLQERFPYGGPVRVPVCPIADTHKAEIPQMKKKKKKSHEWLFSYNHCKCHEENNTVIFLFHHLKIHHYTSEKEKNFDIVV